jgi:acyl-CoA thioesterase-2
VAEPAQDDQGRVLDELISAITARPTGGEGYVAQCPDWWEGDRVFGGMVVAQALSAALQTVEPSRPVHSLHGYFLRPVPQGSTLEITVRAVRDGRSFSTREVTSLVDGQAAFTMVASFHVPEDGEEYQLSMPDVAGPDTLESWDTAVPLDFRELGPTPVAEDGTYRSTRRTWVRAQHRVEDPAVHQVLLAYLSDMTGASFRPGSLGSWGAHTDASLDHALWFHRPARVDEWLLYDLQAVLNSAGRATVRGLLFTQAGELCLSMAQELLIRRIEGAVPQTLPGWATSAPKVDPRSL